MKQLEYATQTTEKKPRIELNNQKVIDYRFVVDLGDHEIYFDAEPDRIWDIMILFKTEIGFYEHKLKPLTAQYNMTEKFLESCLWDVVSDYYDGRD